MARIRANYPNNADHIWAKKHIYTCLVCHYIGHSRRACPNQPVEHRRAQRAQDQLIINLNNQGKYYN